MRISPFHRHDDLNLKQIKKEEGKNGNEGMEVKLKGSEELT